MLVLEKDNEEADLPQKRPHNTLNLRINHFLEIWILGSLQSMLPIKFQSECNFLGGFYPFKVYHFSVPLRHHYLVITHLSLLHTIPFSNLRECESTEADGHNKLMKPSTLDCPIFFCTDPSRGMRNSSPSHHP